MPANSFARIGYKNASNQFTPIDVRAQDVFTTTGVSAEGHIVDTSKHLTTTQASLISGAIQSSEKGVTNGVAPLGADGKIPSQYSSTNILSNSLIVADYPMLLTLTEEEAPLTTTVFVREALSDPGVTSGWALYFRIDVQGGSTDWQKLAEEESLDIDSSAFISSSDKNTANGVAGLDGNAKIASANLPTATTSSTGITQLNNAIDSTNETTAATPKAVKTANDNAILLDAAYCTDEADMLAKNLRVGAIVLMEVENIM